LSLTKRDQRIPNALANDCSNDEVCVPLGITLKVAILIHSEEGWICAVEASRVRNSLCSGE